MFDEEVSGREESALRSVGGALEAQQVYIPFSICNKMDLSWLDSHVPYERARKSIDKPSHGLTRGFDPSQIFNIINALAKPFL